MPKRHLHLNSSGGNFRWVQQGLGLSLARTALSASTSVLFSIMADVFVKAYYRQKTGLCQGVAYEAEELSDCSFRVRRRFVFILFYAVMFY